MDPPRHAEPDPFLGHDRGDRGRRLGIVLLSNLFLASSSGRADLWSKLELAKSPADRLQVAEDNPDSPVATWARLEAATEYYNQGFSDLPNNRDAALPNLKKALDQFEIVAKDAPADSPQARAAALGKARTLEARNEIAKAIETYRQVEKRWPGSPEAGQAKQLADVLDKPEAAGVLQGLVRLLADQGDAAADGHGQVQSPALAVARVRRPRRGGESRQPPAVDPPAAAPAAKPAVEGRHGPGDPQVGRTDGAGDHGPGHAGQARGRIAGQPLLPAVRHPESKSRRPRLPSPHRPPPRSPSPERPRGEFLTGDRPESSKTPSHLHVLTRPMRTSPLSETPQEFEVKQRTDGRRIDAYLASRFTDYSRSVIQKVIDAEAVLVNGQPVKASYKVRVGDVVRVWLPELPDTAPVPEDIPIDVVYEDEALTVVNKPPGMVTHPAKGNWSGTLVNALQFHYDTLSTVGGENRPGIVHRLDRDTTGLLVVAKDDLAHRHLALQFEQRKIHKEYLALVYGVPQRDSDYIEKPIGFHPPTREKMAIRSPEDGGKEASTFYEVLERFRGYALVRCKPQTGRTHQIRVHLTHIGHPIVADKAYSGRDRLTLGDLLGPFARGPKRRARSDDRPHRSPGARTPIPSLHPSADRRGGPPDGSAPGGHGPDTRGVSEVSGDSGEPESVQGEYESFESRGPETEVREKVISGQYPRSPRSGDIGRQVTLAASDLPVGSARDLTERQIVKGQVCRSVVLEDGDRLVDRRAHRRGRDAADAHQG